MTLERRKNIVEQFTIELRYNETSESCAYNGVIGLYNKIIVSMPAI